MQVEWKERFPSYFPLYVRRRHNFSLHLPNMKNVALGENLEMDEGFKLRMKKYKIAHHLDRRRRS